MLVGNIGDCIKFIESSDESFQRVNLEVELERCQTLFSVEMSSDDDCDCYASVESLS